MHGQGFIHGFGYVTDGGWVEGTYVLSHQEGLRGILTATKFVNMAREMAMKASIYKQRIHQGDSVGPKGCPAMTMLVMD